MCFDLNYALICWHVSCACFLPPPPLPPLQRKVKVERTSASSCSSSVWLRLVVYSPLLLRSSGPLSSSPSLLFHLNPSLNLLILDSFQEWFCQKTRAWLQTFLMFPFSGFLCFACLRPASCEAERESLPYLQHSNSSFVQKISN